MELRIFNFKNEKRYKNITYVICLVALCLFTLLLIYVYSGNYLTAKLYTYGNLLQEEGSFLKAKICYKTAIIFRPESNFASDLHFKLANIYAQEENYKGVVTELYHIIKIDPNFTDIYVPLGQALKELNRFNESRIILEKAVDYELPSGLKIIAYDLLGDVCFSVKDFDNAAHYYEIALKMDPENVSHYLALSSSYAKMGANNKALDII